MHASGHGSTPTSGDDLPLVSVIVPGKDVVRFLGDAFESLSRQFEDPRDIEIVFIDDGSSDGPDAIVERWTTFFPHIQRLRNEVSVGVAEARNQGLAVARGRFIAFLDADDWFAPRHLQILAGEMQRLGCDFVRCDVIQAWGTRRQLRRPPQGLRGVSLDPREGILPVAARTMVDYPWMPAGMFDRRLIDSGLLHFANLATAEDRLSVWSLHLNADSYAVVDSPGLIYRKGVDGSLTGLLDHRRLAYLEAFEKVRLMVERDAECERFMPKVVQTVMALTIRHLEVYSEMDPEIQRLLIAGVRNLLYSFDSSLVNERVRALLPERRDALSMVFEGMRPEWVSS